jgi:hypothetical protein
MDKNAKFLLARRTSALARHELRDDKPPSAHGPRHGPTSAAARIKDPAMVAAINAAAGIKPKTNGGGEQMADPGKFTTTGGEKGGSLQGTPGGARPMPSATANSNVGVGGAHSNPERHQEPGEVKHLLPGEALPVHAAATPRAREISRLRGAAVTLFEHDLVTALALASGAMMARDGYSEALFILRGVRS